MVVAAQQNIRGSLLPQRLILAHIRVGQRDHDVGSGRSQSFRLLGRDIDRRTEFILARAGFLGCGNGCEPEYADLVGSGLHHDGFHRAVQHIAVRVRVVGAQHREIRLRDSFFGNFRTEVEFVVADRHGGHADLVQQIDHVGPFVHAGQQGRRNRVAAEGHDDLAAHLAFRLDDGR